MLDILTGRWELYQAQEKLAECAQTREDKSHLFPRTRGDYCSWRGARLIRPFARIHPARLMVAVRVTEQGEVIYNQYGHPTIARRHLEQVVHGVLLASVPQSLSQD